MIKKVRTVKYRRKRLGKTNYYKRLKLLSSHIPRIVVRKSLNEIQLQLIEYKPEGDKVIISANSKELNKLGWNYPHSNLPASYLTGLLFGTKVKGKVEKAIVDIGFNASIKGSKIYAAVKGVMDAGVNIDCSKEILPTEERIKGSHIAEYAKKLKQNENEYKKQFSKCIKNNAEPEDITKKFEEIKKKILSE